MKMGLTTTLLFIIVITVALSHNASAQSGCTSALLNLSPCLNYVMGNTTTPSSPCCTQLTNIVQSQPSCLCLLFNNNIGITINQTLALQLPGACNVNTPPIGQCNSVANAPTASAATPAGSPAPVSPAESPSTSTDNPESPAATTTALSPSSTGTGSKTVPSTTNGSSSDGNAVRASIPIVALVFVASAVSTLAKF